MSAKRAGLAELMGSAGAKAGGELRLSQLHDLLGDGMPDLPRNAIGRHRLIRALQQRLGPNFRSLPGIKGLVSEFDDSIKHESMKRQLAAIPYDPPKPKGGRRG